MANVYTESVTLTTDGAQAATGYIGTRRDGKSLNGEILRIAYTKDGTTPFTDGVNFTITTETTGQTVWTESNVNASAAKVPVQAAHNNVGVAALAYNDGTRTVPLYRPIHLSHERLKIAIANGGASKVGTFTLTILQND